MENRIVLNVEGVCQQFGEQRVLHDVNLSIVQGQFVSLVGASGCGKSTLFRAILGTDPPTKGTIDTDGIPVEGPNRNVGIVYQRYGLYQFLTAEENVAFGPMLDQTNLFHRTFMPWHWWPKRKKQLEEARELLTRLKLGAVLKSYPSQLSGGQQQRVAIAQSLIMKPKILLLDEPFGALDESTREDLQKMMLKLYAENVAAKQAGGEPPWTVLFVTHELNEAFYVSDRIVGLSRNWYESFPSPSDGEECRRFGYHLGATKVWDKCTPTFHPDAPKDFDRFHEAKTELKHVVLDSNAMPHERNEHVSFWEDLAKGVGTGVAVLKGAP